MLLHDQNEWPEIENLGMDATPGYNTNIRIQRSKVIMESWDGEAGDSVHPSPIWPALYYAPDAICGLDLLLVLGSEGFSPGSDSGHSKLCVVFLGKK